MLEGQDKYHIYVHFVIPCSATLGNLHMDEEGLQYPLDIVEHPVCQGELLDNRLLWDRPGTSAHICQQKLHESYQA
jgi:hypothetical protein